MSLIFALLIIAIGFYCFSKYCKVFVEKDFVRALENKDYNTFVDVVDIYGISKKEELDKFLKRVEWRLMRVLTYHELQEVLTEMLQKHLLNCSKEKCIYILQKANDEEAYFSELVAEMIKRWDLPKTIIPTYKSL